MAQLGRLDLAGDEMTRLLDQVAAFGGVDELLTAAQRGTTRGGQRAQLVSFRHAGDVLGSQEYRVFDAFDRKLITQEEARRLLGRPARKPPARRKPTP